MKIMFSEFSHVNAMIIFWMGVFFGVVQFLLGIFVHVGFLFSGLLVILLFTITAEKTHNAYLLRSNDG